MPVANNSIDATATPIPSNCNSNRGQVRVDIADASSNYIFGIFQGNNLIQSSGPIVDNTYTFDNLNPGEYSVTVNLASVSNCEWTGSVTIAPFENLVPSVVVTKNVDCSDGFISATIQGGQAPFEYSIDGGTSFSAFDNGNQATIPVTNAGDYDVIIKDNNGCEVTANTVTVATEEVATYTIEKEDNKCSGIPDGEITFNVNDPKGFSITFSIDGGNTFSTTKTFRNLPAGTYDTAIKLEKAGGECIETGNQITVAATVPFVVSSQVTQEIDCTNGAASIEATVTSGGAAPFLYSLNGFDFQTTPNFSGLGPGTYTITVKDNNDCITTVDQIVAEGNDPSNITFEEVNYDCTNGTVDVALTVVDGAAPFQYQIIAPIIASSTTNEFTGLEPGTYTFEVTAADGCKIVRNYNVSDPIRLQLTTKLLNQVNCFNATNPNGRLSFTVTDFLNDYDYTVTIVLTRLSLRILEKPPILLN